MSSLVVYGLVAAFVVLLVIWAFWEQRQVETGWAAAAQLLEFELDESGSFPRLSGCFQGFDVQLYQEQVYSRGQSELLMVCQIQFDSPGPALAFRPQGRIDTFLQGAGVRGDLLLGDGEFDHKIEIEAEHIEDVVAFVTPARKAAILKAVAKSDRSMKVEARDDGATRMSRFVESDPEELREIIKGLVELAAILRQ